MKCCKKNQDVSVSVKITDCLVLGHPHIEVKFGDDFINQLADKIASKIGNVPSTSETFVVTLTVGPIVNK